MGAQPGRLDTGEMVTPDLVRRIDQELAGILCKIGDGAYDSARSTRRVRAFEQVAEQIRN